jgi:hypothetical protein
MRGLHQQRGLSFWGVLLAIAIGGFTVLVVLRLGPVYMEYWTISSIAEKVAAEPGIAKANKRILWSKFARHLDINQVRTLKPEHVSMDNDATGATLVVAYERREPLIANVEVVAVFEKRVPTN